MKELVDFKRKVRVKSQPTHFQLEFTASVPNFDTISHRAERRHKQIKTCPRNYRPPDNK